MKPTAYAQKSSMWIRRDFLLAAGTALWAATDAKGQSASGCVFGMVPYLPIQQLVRLYDPLVAQLAHAVASRASGLRP